MLSEQDLEVLESSLLPALERHHLRLLAHSLRCLQQVSGDAAERPDQAALTAWAERQPNLLADPAFIPVLVEQLSKAALQLDQIGQEQGKAPLSLDMADLVAWGKASADRRLAEAGLSPPPRS